MGQQVSRDSTGWIRGHGSDLMWIGLLFIWTGIKAMIHGDMGEVELDHLSLRIND